ncbi:type IV toxin-antitoxin system AbiEi family antitoxin domain-containing protein [Cryobacterium psychrophilum]|uniref:AbiEi antitoxin N-terminal domain-containing protein n=1 Tax=Cryobacterium psychrophilum TaxID=41988 RepID=A0A4Y8KW82_9MICO|nr:AbiEi antitoxin N-terminal domain-containing protein [Cryobacterium psychrophilum]TDW29795.1 putative AbiEi antitoxin of type IV toxin-antitoxin system [Cryobacterium psychrophilum]TFD81890.1 hypothetical protein E3T53_02580 [Cryobacterium psychrophilum]
MKIPTALPRSPFRQSDVARAGVSSRTLYRLRDAGLVEQIARGLYQRMDSQTEDLDLVEAVMRRVESTICLTSALAHHGLTDAIPARTDIAIPRGKAAPTTAPAISWHIFDADTFTLGRTEIPLDGTGRSIGLYSPERSIVDAFRLRGTEGYEIATEALRAWLRQRGSQPAALLEMASKLPRSRGPILRALEYLA